MRIQLLVAYLGPAFTGWQSQKGGRAVQDIMEVALKKVCHVPVRLHGAGRTDAGVHALGQSAHFDEPEGVSLSEPEWVAALNCNLPLTVRILSAHRRPLSFHSRFSSTGKKYRYEISREPILPPLLYQRAWHRPGRLDTEMLQDAMIPFVGEHDFRSFTARRMRPEQSTIRKVEKTSVRVFQKKITIEVEGDGFLYKMIRMMVGSAVRVAAGKMQPDRLLQLLEEPEFGRAQFVAPAEGLYLVRVFYRKR